jgi:hypothetical protein
MNKPRTTGKISNDLKRYGRNRPQTRLRDWALAAGALTLVLGGTVGIEKLKQRHEVHQADLITLLRRNNKTIRDCMLFAEQNMCVRAFPERVASECRVETFETKTSDLGVGIGFSYGPNPMKFGPGVKLDDKTIKQTKLVC